MEKPGILGFVYKTAIIADKIALAQMKIFTDEVMC